MKELLTKKKGRNNTKKNLIKMNKIVQILGEKAILKKEEWHSLQKK